MQVMERNRNTNTDPAESMTTYKKAYAKSATLGAALARQNGKRTRLPAVF